VNDLVRTFRSMGTPTVVVVGDAMLDRYLFGETSRISPEAPIPVVRVVRDEERAGGAASAAMNVRALGANVRIVGFQGTDEAGTALRRLLESAGIDTTALVAVAGRPTTQKTRVVAEGRSHRNRQQVVRVDREDSTTYPPEAEARLLAAFEKVLVGASSVVVSDYAKGVVTSRVIRYVIDRARDAGVPVLVDPKGSDYSRYRGATVVTPNRSEAAQATGIEPRDRDSMLAAGRRVLEIAGVEAAVVTLDKDGMAIVTRSGHEEIVPTTPREVYDVTGAGDVVIATLGVALGDGLPLATAVHLANVAAGVEVGKVGAVPVTREEVLVALGESRPPSHRVLPLPALLEELADVRKSGRTVVFTNGCFDVLHAGHVRYLAAARREGDVLVVGLNSDTSVRRIKGEGRPVNPQDDRAEVLASLAAVDYVVVFDEDTPFETIRAVQPDVLVKGEDWRDKGVVGREIVEARGGRVVLAPLVPGRSTSAVIEKIRGEGGG
jgi:D-beta-D-heptose 7-phosphate kinase/D-beta-D-heptose 1-phosphate adenosyltransferase